MKADFVAAEEIIKNAFPRLPAAQLRIDQDGGTLYRRAFGCLDPQTCSRPASLQTRFDMASVSKLFTAAAFMRLVEAGQVTLDTPVRIVLPEFSGLRPVASYEAPLDEGAFVDVSDSCRDPVDAGKVTFRHLLTHTSGLPAWRPLYLLADAEVARWEVLTSYFSYQTGARVVYSDLGLMLTGFALERLTGQRLDQAVRELVCDPLGLHDTGYFPSGSPALAGLEVAPTEICRWRKRRLHAEVDDENCGRLDGVAGHAGIFSTADDIVAFGRTFLEPGRFLQAETIVEMTRLQAGEGRPARRGIGFDLWTDDPNDSFAAFSSRSFGHTGFTGTSLWIDPQHSRVVAFLTNEVYHGRERRVIGEVRRAVNAAIAAVLPA